MAVKIKNLEMHGRFYRVQYWRDNKRHVIPLNTADQSEALKLRNQIINGDGVIDEALALRTTGRRAWHVQDRVSAISKSGQEAR
jgi:hypothetical protein